MNPLSLLRSFVVVGTLACVGLSTSEAATVDDLARSLPTALEQARKHRDVQYEQSGQMQESYDRAIETLEHVRALRSLLADLFVQARAAGIEGDLNQVAQQLGSKLQPDARTTLFELTSTLANVEDASSLGQQNAEAVLEQVELITQSASFMRPTMRMELAAELLPLLDTAPQFAPGDKALADRVEGERATVAAAVASLIESSRAELAANRWPGGDPSSAVAVAGRTYLQNHRAWGADRSSPTKILRVATHGSWYVAKTDLLGRPLAYAHPAWIAVQEPSTPDGVVHVLNISLVTAHPTRDTRFAEVWVGAGLTQMLEANL